MGNIGTQVARMAAHGLGMKVVGYSRRITRDQEMDFGVLTPDMKKVISGAASTSIPSTPIPCMETTFRLGQASKTRAENLPFITRDQEMDFGVLTPDMKKVISGADYLSLHLPGWAP